MTRVSITTNHSAAVIAPQLVLPLHLPLAQRPAKASAVADTKLKRNAKAPSVTWRPEVSPAPAKGDIEAVRVTLYGKHARGADMTIDLEDWVTVKARYGNRFFVKSVRQGRFFYVSAHNRAARAASGQPSGQGGSLARLIVGATTGQVVVYKDGNHFNLRRSNLGLLIGKRAVAFKLEHVED